MRKKILASMAIYVMIFSTASCAPNKTSNDGDIISKANEVIADTAYEKLREQLPEEIGDDIPDANPENSEDLRDAVENKQKKPEENVAEESEPSGEAGESVDEVAAPLSFDSEHHGISLDDLWHTYDGGIVEFDFDAFMTYYDLIAECDEAYPATYLGCHVGETGVYVTTNVAGEASSSQIYTVDAEGNKTLTEPVVLRETDVSPYVTFVGYAGGVTAAELDAFLIVVHRLMDGYEDCPFTNLGYEHSTYTADGQVIEHND